MRHPINSLTLHRAKRRRQDEDLWDLPMLLVVAPATIFFGWFVVCPLVHHALFALFNAITGLDVKV